MTPEAPKYHDALERRHLNHGEQGEDAEELEILSLRSQLREALATLADARAVNDERREQVKELVAERDAARAEVERLNRACDLFEANSLEASEVFEVLHGASLVPNEKPGPRLGALVRGLVEERDALASQLQAEITAGEEAVRIVVAEEREACAQVADRFAEKLGVRYEMVERVARAIRARGSK